MRMNLLRAGGVVGLAASTALLAVVLPAAGATAGTTAGPGEGSAYGADATVSLLPGVLGADVAHVDTGRLAQSRTEGPSSASAEDASLQGLVTAKVITSDTRHDSTAGDVTGHAELLDAALPVLKTVAGRTPTASVISSTCHATAGGITGSSELAGLDLGALGHVTAPTPNETLGVPGVAQVITDEQIHNADGSLTVNALDIKLLGGRLTGAVGSGSIVLGSTTCGAATERVQDGAPPATGVPQQGKAEVSVVPAGAPETGDGSLAAVVIR